MPYNHKEAGQLNKERHIHTILCLVKQQKNLTKK